MVPALFRVVGARASTASGVDAATLEDATALALAAAAPHAVLDAVLEGVLEAGVEHGQPLQILRARSTPTPSLGKNVAGG
jgi:hypothetical protein